MPVEVYSTTPSVVAGNPIGFCVSVTQPGPDVLVEVYRSSQLAYWDIQFGTQADLLYQGDYRTRISVREGQEPIFQVIVESLSQRIPPQVGSNGCGWTVSATWQTPKNLVSSVYIAKATQGSESSYSLFVVRSEAPGINSKVLCQLSLNTYQAYNPWGGQCFYGPPIAESDPENPPVVSFERPCSLWDYMLYDEPIVTWLEANSSVEFCTNWDVHTDPLLLTPYQLFVSCGHDEYWSGAMRNSVEAFANAGGNVLFLSGNTMYRPVDFVGLTMTRNAITWQALNRPEALTTGANWSAGRWSSPLPRRGYVVSIPDHWIFDGTKLPKGAVLGEQTGIIGYETDAATVPPSPANVVTLAEADLSEWFDQRGKAGLTAYWREQGYILSTSTTGWGQGLRSGGEPAVVQVMRNLVGRMKVRFGIVYAVQGDKLVWYRDRDQYGDGDIGVSKSIGSDGGWDKFKNIFSDETGNIYGLTTGGDLLRYRDSHRDGSGDVRDPVIAGHAIWSAFKFVFAGGDGVLYAVSTTGDLHWYKDELQPNGGSISGGATIGHGGWADYKFVFNGGGGIIYAISNGGELYWYRDSHRDGTGDVGTGRQIGASGWNKFKNVFGDSTGNLYAIDGDSGNLLRYKDTARDGTGSVDVNAGHTIGKRGWQDLTFAFSGS